MSGKSTPDVMTVEEVAKALGISRNTAYQAVASGEIPSIRVRGRIIIPRALYQRMLAGEGKPT